MKYFSLMIIFFTLSLNSHAAVSPVGFGILPPAQLPPTDFSVAGLRMSVLWGEERSVYGFDFGGIGNITTQHSAGVSVSGIFNYNKGMTTVAGLQAAGIANMNINKANIYGLQVALGMNSNKAESVVVGLQVAGVANISPFTKVYGLQAGLYNKARDVYGLQIGLINSADMLHGIQIGLLNFNTRGLFAIAPILNVGF